MTIILGHWRIVNWLAVHREQNLILNVSDFAASSLPSIKLILLSAIACNCGLCHYCIQKPCSESPCPMEYHCESKIYATIKHYFFQLIAFQKMQHASSMSAENWIAIKPQNANLSVAYPHACKQNFCLMRFAVNPLIQVHVQMGLAFFITISETDVVNSFCMVVVVETRIVLALIMNVDVYALEWFSSCNYGAATDGWIRC